MCRREAMRECVSSMRAEGRFSRLHVLPNHTAIFEIVSRRGRLHSSDLTCSAVLIFDNACHMIEVTSVA